MVRGVSLVLFLCALCSCGSTHEQGDAKKDFVGLFEQFAVTVKSCETGVQTVAKAEDDLSKGGDVVEAFAIVKRAQQACSMASSGVRDLNLPDSLSNDAQLKETLDACGATYGSYDTALSTFMEVLDSGGSPSKIVEIKDTLQYARSKSGLCATGWSSSAKRLGVSLPT